MSAATIKHPFRPGELVTLEHALAVQGWLRKIAGDRGPNDRDSWTAVYLWADAIRESERGAA